MAGDIDKTAGFRLARAAMALFTPERPMMVPQRIYDQAAAMPDLADLMDRVKPVGPIPMHPPHPPIARRR